MYTEPHDPRVGLALLIRNLERLLAYFRECLTNARGFMHEEQFVRPIRPNPTDEQETMFLRYYSAAEVFQTVITELEHYLAEAKKPFERRRRKPTPEEAATRLQQIVRRILVGALRFVESELKAKTTFLRGNSGTVGDSELEREIETRLTAVMNAEFSQRIVALQNVSTALRALVDVFLSMFPENSSDG